jgi:hypothetical protein
MFISQILLVETPTVFNKLQEILAEGEMYRTTCFSGVLIAVLAIGCWCVKSYKTLKKRGLQPAIYEMVLPLLLIVMLSNNGKNMKGLTLATKNAMNNFNAPLSRVADTQEQESPTLAFRNHLQNWLITD